MPGQIGWIDLTVPDAPALRNFYQGVTGWTPSPVHMGDYEDFCMHPPGDPQPVAGICHAKGENVGLPPVWLIYIIVDDLDLGISDAARNSAAGCSVRRLPWAPMAASA
jgi:predicted enzyme related to lactoylglutathione lyase